MPAATTVIVSLESKLKGKKIDCFFSVQHDHWPRCKLQVNFGKKRQWGKLNKTPTCSARQVMFWAKSNLTFV